MVIVVNGIATAAVKTNSTKLPVSNCAILDAMKRRERDWVTKAQIK
jgi:hypothetical protein